MVSIAAIVIVLAGLRLNDNWRPSECAASARPVYVPVIRGATIPGLTGSAADIPWADKNPAHYGEYDAPGGSGAGQGLIGGPLLDDLQAVAFVKPTQKSEMEKGPLGPAIAADNNYFNYIASTDAGAYLNQLRGFHAAYEPGRGHASWQAVADRIDGACPMAHPTTAEVLQWAGNKWGINPLLMYAVATNEGHWDQTGIGDNGTSSGLMQVADRGANHSFPGFSESGAMLARENTCFNADFFAAWLFAAFHGLTGENRGGNITAAIQSYNPSSAVYISNTYDALTNRLWITRQFGGVPVPY
jgi:hypothetical protein